MTNDSSQQIVVDPWQGKGERLWLIAALVFLFCLTFGALDGRGFYDQYLKRCTEEPKRIECQPLGLVKEERPPDLGITLDYGKGKWALEVSSGQDEAQTNDLVSRLRSAGVEPRIIKLQDKGKRLWYRVQVGRFVNRKNASEAGALLQAKGFLQNFRLVDYQATR
jgi:hypothetical protein